MLCSHDFQHKPEIWPSRRAKSASQGHQLRVTQPMYWRPIYKDANALTLSTMPWVSLKPCSERGRCFREGMKLPLDDEEGKAALFTKAIDMIELQTRTDEEGAQSC